MKVIPGSRVHLRQIVCQSFAQSHIGLKTHKPHFSLLVIKVIHWHWGSEYWRIDFCRCVAICGTAVWHTRIVSSLEERKPLIECKSKLHCYLFRLLVEARSWICLWGSRLIIWLFFQDLRTICDSAGGSEFYAQSWILFDVAIGFFSEIHAKSNEMESLHNPVRFAIAKNTRKKEPLTPHSPEGSFLAPFFIMILVFSLGVASQQKDIPLELRYSYSSTCYHQRWTFSTCCFGDQC